MVRIPPLTCAGLLCAFLSSVALAQAPRFSSVRIELRPNPRVVPADGQTASTVRAELRDTENRPVSDGTTVVFRIEGGSLDAGGGQRRSAVTVTTSGGAATVWATSTTVGSATIYAEVVTGGGRNQAQVYFTEEGAAAVREARVVHVRGGWVGHAQELGMVEARTGTRGRGQVVFGSVRIVADVVQVDTTTLVVRATDAIIHVGDKSIEALDLYYELMSGQGYVRRIGENGVERLCFDCYTMQETAPEEPIAPEVFRLNQAEALTWAVARSVSIYPYQKIVLRNASIYVDGERLIKLPKYWLIAMPGYAGTTHSQMVSVNSAGELGVDFPYVYRVTETSTGSVKVQRGAANGSVIARDEWSLAVEEAYETDTVRGAVAVAGLPREDWGFEWRETRELDSQRELHVTAYSPDHRSAYLDASMYKWARGHRLNTRGYYNRPHGFGDSYGLSADWLTHSRPLGKWAASYRLGTGVGAGHMDGRDDGLVGEHQVYAGLDFPRRFVSKSTTLTPSLSNLFVWDTGGYHYESVRGELAMRRVISSNASMGLSYEAQYTTGDGARGFEHLLSFNGSVYRGQLWHSYLMATYELEDANTYAYWLLDYYPDEKWRVGLGATYYDFGGDAYDDLEVTLGRRMAGREIGLHWSHETGKVSLELGGFGGFMGF